VTSFSGSLALEEKNSKPTSNSRFQKETENPISSALKNPDRIQ